MLEQCGAGTCQATTPTARYPKSTRPTTRASPGPGTTRRSAAVVRNYRERAEAENLSIRDLVIAVTADSSFVARTAARIPRDDQYVQATPRASSCHLTPHGWMSLSTGWCAIAGTRRIRTGYAGETLREHLGLGVSLVVART